MPHTRRQLIAFTFIALGFAASFAGPAEGQYPPMAAGEGWVKLPAQGETSTTAFVAIDNPTMYDHYLVSASTDVAAKVEFREAGEDGTVKPEPVKEVTVPAYGSLSMSPTGIHLRLVDLKQPLQAGDTVSIVVKNEAGDEFRIAAVVKAP